MTGIRWENKTPHVVRVLNAAGMVVMELPRSRYAIRVNQPFKALIAVDGVPIGRFEGVPQFKNMPDPIREDTIYVVSGITASLIRRWNFVAPRSDSAGQDRCVDMSVFATKSFITFGELVI